MKIRKDVSTLQKKLAQSFVLRKRGVVPEKKADNSTDDRVKKAREEAIKSRKELQAKNRAEAEKDVRIQELQEALEKAEARANEAEPAAKRWNDYSHKEKERMIAKLPKEMQREARDMDIKHLALLVGNYTGNGPAPTGATGAAGTKIGSLKEAEKAPAKEYNEFMDGIKKGTIQIDSEGKVLAAA